jgi:nicotinamide-nucleotide amidase
VSPGAGRAAVLAIGDELVAGEIHDRNSPWLCERLGAEGFRVEEVRLLPDDEPEIARSLAEAARGRDLVISDGGLGPTLDDVTRHAAARAAGVPLEEDAATLAGLATHWAARGLAVPASNRRQALFPAGAAILANPVGTAPGFRVRVGGAWLAVLPGPPRELTAVFEGALAPWLPQVPGHGALVLRRRMHLFGLSESAFADRVGVWMDRDANPRIGVLAREGILIVKLEARAAGEATALELLEARLAELRAALGEHVFSEETDDLAQVVARLALDGDVPLATAESCTGGLVAARLTAVPGISAVFREGFVTYSNEAKVARLGVPRELLERHGAVSAPVAEAMARGAGERTGARLAVSITGVAGPGGGTADKPVGLAYFGLWRDGAVEHAERRYPAFGRDLVRAFATNQALDLLRTALAGGLRGAPRSVDTGRLVP